MSEGRVVRIGGTEVVLSDEEERVVSEVKRDVALKASGGGLALGALTFGMSLRFSALPFKRYQVGLFTAAGVGVGAYAGGILGLRDGINKIVSLPESKLATETRATLEDYHLVGDLPVPSEGEPDE